MASQSETFRTVFRHHPAGVVLITATVDDEPVGLVVSSLSSLAVDPLGVSFSLAKHSGRPGKMLRADSYLIHFLSEDQVDTAREFAATDGRHFTPEQGWTTASTGEPLLPSAPAVFRARTVETVPFGDATLVAAEVLSASATPGMLAGELPRVFYVNRAFQVRPAAD